jgi:phenylacetic acid degradation operon negative regulatory protein
VRRTVLARARLAELRQGVWLRPDNLPLDLAGMSDDGAAVFRSRPTTDDAALAASLWDLGAWSARARELRRDLDALVPRGPDELAPGFVLSAAVLRHFQADPLLPPALLPPDWPGEDLRRVYDEWDARYRDVLVRWTRTA